MQVVLTLVTIFFTFSILGCGVEVSPKNQRGEKSSKGFFSERDSGDATPTSDFEAGTGDSQTVLKPTTSNTTSTKKSTKKSTDGSKKENVEGNVSEFAKYYTTKAVSYSQVIPHPNLRSTTTGLRMTQTQDGPLLTVHFNFASTSDTFRSACKIFAEYRETGDTIHTFTPSKPEYTWQDVKNFDFNLYMACGTAPKNLLVLGTSPGVLVVDAQYIPNTDRFSTLNFNPLFVLSKKFPNHDVTKTAVGAALENSEATANAYCKKMGYRISTFRGSVFPGSIRDRFHSPIDNLMFVANAAGNDIVRTQALGSHKWATSIRCEL